MACFWLSWLAGHSFKPRHSFHSTRQHLTFLGPLIVFSTAVCKRPHSLFSSEALAFGVHSLDWQHLVQHLFLVFAAFGLNGASRICQCFASYHSLLWVHNLLLSTQRLANLSGSITSIQAIYVPADDLTDPTPVAIFGADECFEGWLAFGYHGILGSHSFVNPFLAFRPVSSHSSHFLHSAGCLGSNLENVLSQLRKVSTLSNLAIFSFWRRAK